MNIIRYLQGERRGLGSQFKTPTYEQKVKSLFAPSIAIPNIVLIPDVSFYQEAIDFVKMKAAGVDGVIIRAGQRYWVDPKFSINWEAAKSAGLLRGSYWFYDGREDPKKQANLWYSLIKSDMGELVHVPDLEDNYGGTYANKASRKLFVSEFQSVSKLPDKKIVIYSGFYWWNENMGADAWFSKYRLWLAWYSPEEVVRVPAPWTESGLILWQYTSSGDGAKYGVTSKEIDLSWYNGTPAQFAAEFGTVSEPTEPPTGGSMYLQATGSQLMREAGNSSAPAAKLAGAAQYVLGPMSGSGAYLGDIIETDAAVGGYYKIKRLWRNSSWSQLPPAAYCTTNYFKSVTFTPPDDPIVTPPPTVDLTEVNTKLAQIAGSVTNVFQQLSKLDQLQADVTVIKDRTNDHMLNLALVKADTEEILDVVNSDSTTVPNAASDGYTGPRMGVYEVIDVPSDPINQQWSNGAVPLFDDNGGDRLQIKEQLYDLWMNTLEGFKELVDSGTIVTDEKGLRFILGKAVKGQQLLIAAQGKSDGVMKGQIVGFSNEDNPLVGAVNFTSCTPETTPWLFNKVKNVRRFIPIMTGNKGNNWWIPMSWLKKVA